MSQLTDTTPLLARIGREKALMGLFQLHMAMSWQRVDTPEQVQLGFLHYVGCC
ncbi:MAG: hypothetical protein H7Z75_11040 [Ferruginibacter sp.]|nr:hypothetical protein [Cytophagales bacterium]